MFDRFQALVLREWMQHKRGWLLTLLAPPLIFLLLVPFGQVEGLPVERPLAAAVFVTLAAGVGLLGIALVVSGVQWPGLARRDVQDRSIEFWLSLPGRHSESLGATLFSHGVLLPLAAVACGYVFGLVIANALLLKVGGLEAWRGLSWSASLAGTLPLLGRGLIGVVLMAVWLAPVVLTLMAASAWLKRWGLPALGLAIFGVGLWLSQAYGNPIVFQLLHQQFDGALGALVAEPDGLSAYLQSLMHDGPVPSVLSWAVQDVGRAVSALASAQCLGGLAVAAGCFYLLVLKRQRGG